MCKRALPRNHRNMKEKLGRHLWTDEHLCFDALKWHIAAAKNRPELCRAQGGDDMRAGLLPGEAHATIPASKSLSILHRTSGICRPATAATAGAAAGKPAGSMDDGNMGGNMCGGSIASNRFGGNMPGGIMGSGSSPSLSPM